MSDENNTRMIIDNPPEAGKTIEGLRDTGYTLNSAIADLIDNSITAKATKVFVEIHIDSRTNLPLVYIGDNGTGMSSDALIYAMRYGSNSTAKDDPLGKFGLGLKTASTAFCRDLCVVTREQSGAVSKAEWNLDYVVEKNAWKMIVSEPDENELELLDSVTEGGSGTLVEWKNVDKLFTKQYKRQTSANAALNKIAESLTHHLGLTFESFLDVNNTNYPNVEIYVNQLNRVAYTSVAPWDPFGLKYGSLIRKFATPVLLDENNEAAPFDIQAYVIPRQDEVNDPAINKDLNMINDYQGIYVYRDGRLIHFGDYLGMANKEQHYENLRIKLSFHKEADSIFNIDIKKSTIRLGEYWINLLQPIIKRWIKDATKIYRGGQVINVDKNGSESHIAAGESIDSMAPNISNSRVTSVNPVNKTAVILNSSGSFQKNFPFAFESATNKNFIRIIPIKGDSDSWLWQSDVQLDPETGEMKEVVDINESHPFYIKIYGPYLKDKSVVRGLDYLFWALAESELATLNESDKERYHDLRDNVASILRKLVKDLPDPEPDNGEDGQGKDDDSKN